MSQKTNLNILPYFDDFDSDKNFYRVLFKPGFPVQARELTSLQSILQNQIKSFGSHIFKDGSVVVPGNVSYNSNYYAVKINSTHVGISVGLYLKNLIGKKIRGQTSQLTAIVQNAITNVESETGEYTLYVKYISSDSSFQITQFRDGETLILDDDALTYGNTTILRGNTFANLISLNATATGSSVSISEGIYFIRGHFVKVENDTLILDQYSNTPSYRVGLFVNEVLVDAKDDPSLYDNALGFSNYSAPGADRLKITATLFKKKITDIEDKDFIEILRINEGRIKKVQDTNTYSQIREYFAKRTYEESGNYAVDQFDVEVSDSLNDRINSDGIFYEQQKTDEGNTPSENLLSVKVSPGRAYIKGFDVEKVTTTILDVEKPRDTLTIANSSVPFEMGNLLKVNNVSGSPIVGLDNNFSVSLYARRKDSNNSNPSVQIGSARVYSFNVSDSLYEDNSSSWDLYLYDIQTYTVLTLNKGLTSEECPETTHVRGVSSGASGYVVGSPYGDKININQTSGSFNVGEQILINGTSEYSRSVSEINVYGSKDIKSVYQNVVGLATPFAADTVLQKTTLQNFNKNDFLTIGAGIASCTGRNFAGIKTDTIIRYQRPGFSTETYNRISSVSEDGILISVSGVTTVPGLCDGAVPSQSITVPFSIGLPSIREEDKAFLYAKLNSKNISNVNLSNSNFIVTKQVSKSTNNLGEFTISIGELGVGEASFEPFDAERYSIFYSDGIVEPLSRDKISISSDLQSITITGLRVNQANCLVNVTIKKVNIKNKQKSYIRSEKLEITKTASGISSITSGLSTSNYYGMRVEDEEISLNIPDVSSILCVYESLDNVGVDLDSLIFPNGYNLDTLSVLGEKIIGQSSGAVAQIVTRKTSNEIEFVYLNSNKFILNETVLFEESNNNLPIVQIVHGRYTDKTDSYTLDNGQREQYYDYSRIVRKTTSSIPSKKLLVIFNHYNVSENDIGDLYTVKSYSSERYKTDIPILPSGTRLTDILDFRPRVSRFTSSNLSPFSFQSRNFSESGSNTILVLSPNESSSIEYSYYLPRIDKLVLDKNGVFSVIEGVSADNPKQPASIEDAMEIARIELPAYLYNPNEVKISLIDNKRYTMRDIRSLEERIESVEKATSLSLLELNTKSLQIFDSDGISRFKTGFFVDDFKTANFIDFEKSESKCTINLENEELVSDVSSYSIKSQIAPNNSTNIESVDFSTDFSLLDPNIKKTGDLVTLNYTEVKWDNLSQNFATKSIPVNSSSISNYNGFVKLTPSSDTWVRTLDIGESVRIRTQSNWQNTFINNLLTGSEKNDKLRSRNIEFRASGLNPLTNYYSFFGGSSNIDIIPKLLKVSMISGVFSPGETVSGFVGDERLASFRIANSNHKSGKYDVPEEVYVENPYDSLVVLSTYSSSSNTVNIDTFSLSDDADGRFYGYTPEGMVLVGESSGAQATVSSQNLITDSVGDLIGCIFIRNPLSNPAPPASFKSGTKTFRLTSSLSNSSSSSVSVTEATFYNSGIFDTNSYSDTILVRRPPSQVLRDITPLDPLSQSFRTDNDGGFLTSIDLYFSEKDSTEKIFVEIRETDIGGTPKQKLIQNFARVEVLPSDITVSSTGSEKTNIKFPSPIYLEPNKQYALTITCPSSNKYKVWVAEATKPTTETQNYPNSQQVIYSNQYTGGNLFKSQNGSIWVPSIYEDLKFNFYKANFTSKAGTAYFYNPPISIGGTFANYDSNLYKLQNNPIKTLPRKIIFGVSGSTTLPLVLKKGVKVSEGDTYGYVEDLGGPIGLITTTSVGVGYSDGTFSGVPLYSITGFGNGATATITISSNRVSSVSIANTGRGYKEGDLLGITTSNISKGSGATLTVSSISGVDTILLTDVKGQNFALGNTISYYNGQTQVSMSGTTVAVASLPLNDFYDGNVFEVSHYNHGMHSNSNVLTLGGVKPNTSPVNLTTNITSSSTTISVANTSEFSVFEGEPIGESNPGYVLVNNEIISYTSVNIGSLSILNRGVNDSIIRNHNINDLVYKYELNGVSLTRINKSHSMPSEQIFKSNRGIDKYHLKFDRGNVRNSGDSMLNFETENNLGGKNCRASQNIQFNQIIPQFNVICPERTTTSSSIRTVSGTSSGGSETSFLDRGFENVSLNNPNDFSSTRLICSKINESSKLSSLPRNRSLTLGIRMETENSNVSPVIDLTETATFILNRNRLNNPVSNYSSDSRVNSIIDDPHSSVYISKQVNLSKPASSLKVYLTSSRPPSSDFRVLYRLIRPDSSEVNQSFELFPGYRNLKDMDGDGIGETVINEYLKDGSSDIFVSSNVEGEYSEYQYTVENLEQFNGFIIKIVMSGTNEAETPKIADLRAIALA